MASKKITDEQLKSELSNGLTTRQISIKYSISERVLRQRKAKLIQKSPNELKTWLERVKHKDDPTPGEVLIWHRETAHDKSASNFLAAILDSIDPIKPSKLARLERPAEETDVIPWFNIGDGHLGMVAYEREVGWSFDVDIAVRDLCKAFEIMVTRAGGHERCVIQDMGDMTHYENYGGKTDASGHDLDYDTRYGKMSRAYVKTMLFMINTAMTQFKYVDVIINQGNHSRTNDLMMCSFLTELYRNSERVNILNNDSVFIPYRMGNTFVLSHHGDKCKPSKVAHVMATDYRHDWGETEYHYVDIGHVHHNMVVKEHPGCKVESFNQLATMDKYANDGGWRSRSCLTTVLRSKTYGEIGRHTLTLEEVRDILQNAKAGTTANIRREVYSV